MKSPTVTAYDKTFFDRQYAGSYSSSRAIVPIALNLIQARSVVDFGCGRGTWLKACQEAGVETILGLDGNYVDREALLIDQGQFRAVDLQQPIRLEHRFDLALCMEVAEHLPAKSARTLVESLAAAAPVVLFSAALPGQGGTCHINEQWPLYWERLFAERGMRKHDVLRPLIWRDRSIGDCYRQNIYIFAEYSHCRNFDFMDQFEPDFLLVTSNVMSRATFGYSSRALKYLPLIRVVQSILSRLTSSR